MSFLQLTSRESKQASRHSFQVLQIRIEHSPSFHNSLSSFKTLDTFSHEQTETKKKMKTS